MAREFLGRGWHFPVTLDAAGRIAEASEEDKVRQSIEILLRTAPGERMMRPDFGCGIHDLVFDTLTDEMLGRVAVAIRDAIARWEPRADLLGVTAQPDPRESTRLLVEIVYRVRSTNSRFNLVFPFYVQ